MGIVFEGSIKVSIIELLLAGVKKVPCMPMGMDLTVPSLQEISLIGEENFLLGGHLLCIDKKNYKIDKDQEITNVGFLAAILTQEPDRKKLFDFIFTMMFKGVKNTTIIENNVIINREQEYGNAIILTEELLEDLQENYFKYLFNFHNAELKKYNPGNAMAEIIAEKLARGRERARNSGYDPVTSNTQEADVGFIFKFAPILSVGLQIPLETIYQYNYYQFILTVKKFMAYYENDVNMRVALAGGSNEEESENPSFFVGII